MMKPSTLTHPRYLFIDYLRAFVFMLLAFDHTIHAYAFHWGKFHFFQDFDRTWVCDVLFMHNNSIIMPMLFFIFGLFVIPSAERRGVGGYAKQRLLKLGIPYVLGILFVVPLLVYPRYEFTENPGIGYWDFWREVYFAEKIQGGGPFWVLYCLALYSTILLLLYSLVPKLLELLSRAFQWMINHPVGGFCIFAGLSMVILGASDLRWGAPWWIGFGSFESDGNVFLEGVNKILGLFHLQGSRFLLHALYFTAGAALSYGGILENKEFWTRLSERWGFFLILTLLSGLFYMGYSLTYFEEGAYNNALRYYLKYQGGKLAESGPLWISEVPWVLIRTSLHGLFCLCQALTVLGIFYRFANRPQRFWTSLAQNSYGIFLLHEIPVIWLQYGLVNSELPIFVKVVLIFTLGFGGTWIVVKALRTLPGVAKIL